MTHRYRDEHPPVREEVHAAHLAYQTEVAGHFQRLRESAQGNQNWAIHVSRVPILRIRTHQNRAQA